MVDLIGCIKPIVIKGVGSYLPEHVVTNDDLAKVVDTSDEWIRTRTGIGERHLAAEGEACSDLAVRAAQRAIEDAGLESIDIDLLIVATVTPDHVTPSSAVFIQSKLGLRSVPSFDINAACSGFLYALETARSLLQNERYRHALVIGSEKLSSIVNWKDRGTCVLFGDGAGAFVLGNGASDLPAVTDGLAGADGSAANLLYVPAGGSAQPASKETVEKHLHTVTMNGKELFKAAVRHMAEATEELLKRNGLTIDDIAWFVPHQANIRIVQTLAQQLNVPMERFVCNIEHTGNTSAASIPIAFAQAKAERRFHKDDRIVLTAFGAGLTWAATLVEW